jgi:hypothetical protein
MLKEVYDWKTDVVSWHGHIPFSFDLVKNIKPEVIVELGTHKGDSYFSFCNAVLANNLSCKCYAVDTWIGDKHSGLYNNTIFENVSEYNKRFNFSTLLRIPFDKAINYFNNNDIDILHIDGLHTYEAVKHDFYSWISKVNEETGVILLHDTEVKKDDFGVYKLWEELKKEYEYTYEFKHSNGLGVIFLADCEFYQYLKNSNVKILQKGGD